MYRDVTRVTHSRSAVVLFIQAATYGLSTNLVQFRHMAGHCVNDTAYFPVAWYIRINVHSMHSRDRPSAYKIVPSGWRKCQMGGTMTVVT